MPFAPNWLGVDMAPYQARVVAERDDLLAKTEKLRSFVRGTHFPLVERGERRRLIAQELAMSDYLECLNERIEAFECSPES